MGHPMPMTPLDSAPAYEDVVHQHPVNRYAQSGSSSAVSHISPRDFLSSKLTSAKYAAVPQDDVEPQEDAHVHSGETPSPASEQPESLVQTIAGVFRPKPHVHCEACDNMTQARMRRENQKHCCTMVAFTFIALFLCTMILGIIIANVTTKRKHHD
ncbi:hypothetical protein BCR34DRAFT_583796 [Clohesyomyces aquaticus]|uniref:LITAF domain-containing protein n=1 Tax=Clohesyomyces aquaticus TaxID=1231657 RepID=A0A1Y2A4B7_9PLEO|nr:hypothetical protein BCR34DRAFT_583796 [Clohesyomyces aquaticus]